MTRSHRAWVDTESLRFRFVFAAFLWVTIATIVAGLVISGLYRRHLTVQFREELQVHLSELVGLSALDAKGHSVLTRPLSDPRFLESGSGFYWQIDRVGSPSRKSATLGNRQLSGAFATAKVQHSGWTAGPYGRVLEYGIVAPSPAGGMPLRISIASDERLLDETLAGFSRDLAVSLLVFAALMFGGATLQIVYGLGPLRRIGDDIDRLRRGTLARLPTDVPSEFSALVSRLNGLLDSQAALVQRARVEAGNLAHGLRTPLALVGDEAEQLKLRGEAVSAEFIFAQCDRMQRQIDYHMMRASAAGTRLTGDLANVATLAQAIVSAMRRLHAARNLTFIVDVPPTLDVNFDSGDLSELLSNLIDNSCKWAAQTITVQAWRDASGVIIDVIDDGPGIAPALREEVFVIGTRLDERRAGQGLGLAISRDLARLYGGDLTLLEALGGGVRARLAVPDQLSQSY